MTRKVFYRPAPRAPGSRRTPRIPKVFEFKEEHRVFLEETFEATCEAMD